MAFLYVLGIYMAVGLLTFAGLLLDDCFSLTKAQNENWDWEEMRVAFLLCLFMPWLIWIIEVIFLFYPE